MILSGASFFVFVFFLFFIFLNYCYCSNALFHVFVVVIGASIVIIVIGYVLYFRIH